MADDSWLEIPGQFGDPQAIAIIEALSGAGVEWRRTQVSAGAGRAAGTIRHVIHVPAANARVAARLVGEALGLEDPERALPFSGECPGCGEPLTEVWTCGSCELSFRSPFQAKDPTICFVREHGGFEEL